MNKRLFAWIGIGITVFLFGMLVRFGIKGGSGDTSTGGTGIGVIGGADGPTAVFVTRGAGINWGEVTLLLLAAGVVIYFIIKANKGGQ